MALRPASPITSVGRFDTVDEAQVETPWRQRSPEPLVRHAGTLVSQRQLLQDVSGPDYGEETNYLRVHMAHIRRELEPDPSRPRYLITEPGMGYRFERTED